MFTVKLFKLYLPKQEDWCVDSIRLQQIFNQIPLDGQPNEVRIYIEGSDFNKLDSPHQLPYATINGKKKSMDNLWKEVIGDKELHGT